MQMRCREQDNYRYTRDSIFGYKIYDEERQVAYKKKNKQRKKEEATGELHKRLIEYIPCEGKVL